MAGYALRLATTADLPALRALYAAATEARGPSAFSPEQVRAWVAFADDEKEFARFVLDATTFVAEDKAGDKTGPIGFAGLDPDGRIVSLYVRPDCERRGVGSALLRHVLAEAEALGIDRLYTHASPYSRPVFERAGFRFVGIAHATRRGVAFTLPRMERP